MELPSEEGDEMPIPLNSTYGGGHGHGHMIHHHHHHDLHPAPAPSPHNHNHNHNHNHIIIPSSTTPPPLPPPQIASSGPPSIDDHVPPFLINKKLIRYRECLKNHAASMGGNATDGCGEFMPSGDEGTLEALTCSACSCHRNFHRKEIDGETAAACDSTCYHNPRIGRKLFVGHHHHHPHKGGYMGPDSIGYHHAAGALISSRPPPQMIMSYSMGGGGGGSLPSESDEQEGRAPQMVKKRFRTKFSQEQKEKMLDFAEKVGWKIQKQEEGVVQQFCQEVGVKRRVLKVWMHNNKHTLAKKTTSLHLSEDAQDHQTLGTD